MELEDWRSKINAINDELLRLLNQRARLALKVGESKKDLWPVQVVHETSRHLQSGLYTEAFRRELPQLAAQRISLHLGRKLQPSQFIAITPEDIACTSHFVARSIAVASGHTYGGRIGCFWARPRFGRSF